MSSPYTIGYGKPPQWSKFQKGKSGNPKGRPKQTLDFKKIFVDELKSTMKITEDGQQKEVTKLEAATKFLVVRALKGDRTMLKLLLDTLKTLPKDAFADDDIDFPHHLSDKQLNALEQFMAETAEYQMLEEATSSAQKVDG